MNSDAQAALAAAAQIVANNGYAPSPLTAEQITLTMADGFLRWLRRSSHTTIERHADERLIPNEDFRSPSAARTERIDPSAVLAAAAPTQQVPTVDTSWRYAGPHVRGGPACVTPSGANACLCGEKWPCSQALSMARRLRGEERP